VTAAIEVARGAPLGWAALAADLGTFYHQPAWIDGIAGCYRYPVHYISCRDGSGLLGGVALAEVPSLWGRRRLVSYPFSYAAGPLSRDPAITAQLTTATQDLARTIGSTRVELKQVAGTTAPPPGFERHTHYATYRVDTRGGEREMWGRLHAGSTQRSIKKGLKAGMTVAVGESPDDWRAMAVLEERTAHRHGLPAPPRRFFVEVCRDLQQRGLATLLLARLPTGIIAAGIVIWKGYHAWIYSFGASDPALLAYRPNHVLLWQALRDAADAGVSFDLGRAAPEQQGLVEFKTRWGGVAVPLDYDYWPAVGGLNVARRDRGVLAVAATVWSRLPTFVVRRASGLYRYLG
jgi:hypothetical protein